MAEVEQWANELAGRRRRGETITLDAEIEVQTLLVRALIAIEARQQDHQRVSVLQHVHSAAPSRRASLR
jgi:hypothetical protein